MLEPLSQTLLAVLGLACIAAFAVMAVMSRRWRREHGDPPDPPVVDPELTRFGTPFAPIRTRSARLVKEGRAADDPATAYVTHRLAERELAVRANPWVTRGYALLPMAQTPMIIHHGLSSPADSPFFLGFFVVVLVLTAAASVLAHRHTRGRRANSERALELNRELAARYAARTAVRTPPEEGAR
jgi:hypothetical protein